MLQTSFFGSLLKFLGPSWPWSYGSWIYKYLCHQCLPPLMLWVRISIRERCTTLCDSLSVTGLDINVCLIPVKTDVGQVDLVPRLSDSAKMTPTFWRLFSMTKMCCFVIFTDINFVNNYFNVFKNIGFHWSTLSLIITVNQEIFRNIFSVIWLNDNWH